MLSLHYPANTYPGQDKPLADNTHFNPYGAYQIAKCVIEGMKQAGLPLVKYLRTDNEGYDPACPDARETLNGMKVHLRNWKSRTVIERGFREPTSLYPESQFLPGVTPAGHLPCMPFNAFDTPNRVSLMAFASSSILIFSIFSPEGRSMWERIKSAIRASSFSGTFVHKRL